MKRPLLPSDDALALAREHILWFVGANPRLGPGEFLLGGCHILWPHEREPSWNDAMLILAAWWDGIEGEPQYRHDRKVISFNKLRRVA